MVVLVCGGVLVLIARVNKKPGLPGFLYQGAGCGVLMEGAVAAGLGRPCGAIRPKNEATYSNTIMAMENTSRQIKDLSTFSELSFPPLTKCESALNRLNNTASKASRTMSFIHMANLVGDDQVQECK